MPPLFFIQLPASTTILPSPLEGLVSFAVHGDANDGPARMKRFSREC
jgi:hypothetical protein